MTDKINDRTPEEIKKGLELCCVGRCSECPYREECDEHLACGGDMLPADVVLTDILALIQQLQEDKKHLQEIICNQRRQLRLLHAMYEWALRRLQTARLNDRAHFQAWLREKGYDLKTMELPESKYQQLERERDQYKRERDAAVKDLESASACFACKSFKRNGGNCFGGSTCAHNLHMANLAGVEYNGPSWQWRGVQKEVE